MDFGAIIKAPTLDPDWIKKCVIMGLINFIPFAGQFNLLGWSKAAYNNAKNGDPTLPEAGFQYIGPGFEVFMALLPAILVVMVFRIVPQVVMMVGLRSVGVLLALLGLPIVLFISFVVYPVLTYRNFTQNTGFGAAMDVASNMKVITANTGLFITYALINFVAGLIAMVGLCGFCIGIALTAPLAAGIIANAIKQFESGGGGV